jgi:hypothetical protein
LGVAKTRIPRTFIIEGIPGSGKDTLTDTLLKLLHQDMRPVYHYSEKALGFSYTHWFWPGTTQARLSLMEAALDFVKEESQRHSQAVFVFNRFHLSLAASLEQTPRDPAATLGYYQLLERLRRMSVLVLLLELEQWKLDSVLHPERVRRELVWKLLLTRRLAESPYSTFQDLYKAEQEQYRGHLRGRVSPIRPVRLLSFWVLWPVFAGLCRLCSARLPSSGRRAPARGSALLSSQVSGMSSSRKLAP